MEFIRLACYMFTILQLVEISIGKSVRGKVRSTAAKKSKRKEQAVYGQLYEDTKNDVNRAIENAILEASKKATDMVLEPKMQTKIVDQMAKQMSTELNTAAGSGEANSGKNEESAMDRQVKKVSKKHHKAKLLKQPKEAVKSTVDSTFEPRDSSVLSHRKSDAKDDEGIETSVVNLEEEEGSTSSETTKEESKIKKHVKKFKPKKHDTELNVIDATESSGSDPVKGLTEEDTKADTEDDDEPEEEEKSVTKEKSEVLPPITEGKADSPAPAAVEEEGQEDLKQLLDESITNLIKANSAVEVLLKATNQRMQAGQQPYLQDRQCGLHCNRTLSAPPPYQTAPLPPCALHNRCIIPKQPFLL